MENLSNGISHLQLGLRDIVPPRMAIAAATRVTIDMVGYRAALFDLVSTLAGGVSAVAKHGEKFTISLGDQLTVTIEMPFPGIHGSRPEVQDMIRELQTEPPATEEEAREAFMYCATALVMDAAVRQGRDPFELADEIAEECKRDQAKRNQHLN